MLPLTAADIASLRQARGTPHVIAGMLYFVAGVLAIWWWPSAGAEAGNHNALLVALAVLAGSCVLVHGWITWEHRRAKRALQADLRQGTKLRDRATILAIEEDPEVNAWWMRARGDGDGAVHRYPVSGWRGDVATGALPGRRVLIEYAINSRHLLHAELLGDAAETTPFDEKPHGTH